MGRAISMAVVVLAGARVAGQLTYVPAHKKNGESVNSRCIIPVYCNSHRGHNQKTGEAGRTNSFRLVAWGKLADVCCKSLPKGKAIDVKCRPESYLGKLYNQDGTLRYDAAGQPIEIVKVAFTIEDIVFGEESSKTVAEEIQLGRRPINWAVPNHPDYAMWIQILEARQAMTWDGRSPEFLFARVAVPQGQGIVLDFSQPAAGGLPGMIANAFGGTPAPAVAATPLFDPMTGQPLAKFDPMTGRPLTASIPQVGAPWSQPVANQVAASGYAAPNVPVPAGPIGTPLF